MFVHARREDFERAFLALLVRYGAQGDDLAGALHDAVSAAEEALAETSTDGSALSPLDVVRIRAGKFAAVRVPAAVFRDPARLAALRREIHGLSVLLLAAEQAQGSRF